MKLLVNNTNVPIFRFPSGEPHFKIETRTIINCTVTTEVLTFEDLVLLGMIVNTVRQRNSNTSISLTVGYIWGSRQDRITNVNEPFTLKTVIDILNSYNLNSITVHYPHSDAIHFLKNVKISRDIDKLVYVLKKHNIQNIVAPDLGASKWIINVVKDVAAKEHLHLNVIQGLKYRDTDTGKLSGFGIMGEINPDQKYLFLDDICDGGGTFLGLAEEFHKKGAKNLYLLVAHGFFTKGKDQLSKIFKSIYSIYERPSK